MSTALLFLSCSFWFALPKPPDIKRGHDTLEMIEK
jgi:hypothetical protein